jgi:fructose-1,6-bisphosphatase
MLVYSIGKGVHSFTLDPSLGEFILSDENIQIPNHGPVYSVNEGNFWQWDDSIGNISAMSTAQKVIPLDMVGQWLEIFIGF